MIGPRAIFHIGSALVIATAIHAAAPSGSYQEFEELRNRAMTAERAGRWQEANALWEQAHAIAPKAFQPLASLASLAAKLQQRDKAFAWLAEAYAGCFADPVLGFVNPAFLAKDEAYASLHGDPRWDALLTTLKTQCADGARGWLTRQPDPDPTGAPSFKSYRKLDAVLDRERQDYENDRWHISLAEQHATTAAIRDQRRAALLRYLAEHPKAADRAEAAWDEIETQIWPRYIYRLSDRWGSLGTQVLDKIDEFLRDYPSSAHRGEAALYRAFVAFLVRPDGGTEEHPWRDTDIQALDGSLTRVSQTYSGSTAAGLALAWRLSLALASNDGITPEMRATSAELGKRYGHDKVVQQLMFDLGVTAAMRISRVADFVGTDLKGTRWTSASFRGRVTVISFWATWCGPCLGEIETIRTLWNAYRDKGLAVVGVSLDFDDRAQFEGWLARNDVGWPQIWDGKGFASPLARRYEVRTIPFMVLVDRDANVVNVNLRGAALMRRIEMLLHDASAVPTVESSPAVSASR